MPDLDRQLVTHEINPEIHLWEEEAVPMKPLKLRRGLMLLALALAQALAIFSAPAVHAQEKCKYELAEAEKQYQDGFFDEAITLLLACVNKSGLAVDESERAYKLLAKAYHANQLLNEAKEALKKLLTLAPNWKPNPETDTPPFQRLAEEVIKEFEQQKLAEEKKPEQKISPAEIIEPVQPVKKKSKKWLWIGGGVLVAGGVTAAILSGGDDKKTDSGFPLPLGRPQ
jgi:tetratricopeptide (TPR) repeat protein